MSSTIIIPTIHLNDNNNKTEIAKRLSVICRTVGFFYLDGHGLEPDFIKQVFSESKAVFALSTEEKKTLSDKSMSRGYTAMQEETLDPTNQTEGDTKEGYYIGRHIPKNDSRYDPKKLRGPNIFPSIDTLPTFRSTMELYLDRLTEIAMKLVRLIALSLNLKETHFDNDFKEPMATLRLLHYSKKQSRPESGVYACGAHSDYGIATLLLTDDQPGLQIYSNSNNNSNNIEGQGDGKWIDIPPRPNSFVVNIGDLLEIWTNGQYKSTIHRVLTTATSTTSTTAADDDADDDDECVKERYSIPFFFDPSFETVVRCLETCTDSNGNSTTNNPPKYPETTAGLYMISKYEGTHADFSPAPDD